LWSDRVTGGPVLVDFDLPPLLHVGIVVLDLDAAAANFERRWGVHVTDITDVTLDDALYHDRVARVSFRRGLIRSGASQIELTQPLSDSPFSDFLRERKGDGVHHLAYIVKDIGPYLERLKPTCAELVLDARLPGDDSRVVVIDGFAHGPSIELIQRNPGAPND
jgi:methylmalonyl-CoA/ethylmalonyl-CoA epimerase